MGYSDILSWLVTNSLKASLLIGGIMIIRQLFARRIGAKWTYRLWYLLLIRLIAPIGFKSKYSIFNYLYNLESREAVRATTNTIPTASINNGMIATNVSKLTIQTPTILVEQNTYIKLLLIIWAVVVVLLLVWILISNLIFKYRLKDYNVADSGEMIGVYNQCLKVMDIKDDIQLISTGLVSTPAIYGILTPKILLPYNIDKMLKIAQLRDIFLHELSHYKRRDMLMLYVNTMLKIIFWFNPVVVYGLNLMKQDAELATDALALDYIREDEVKGYGNTLIELLKFKRLDLRVVGVACTVGNKRHLKRRISMIKSFKHGTVRVPIIAMAMILLLGGLFLTNANDLSEVSNITNQSEIPALDIIDDVVQTVESQPVVIEEEKPMKFSWPLENDFTITSPYGNRMHPILKTKKMHTGIDIRAKENTEIMAIGSGKVSYSDHLGGYGKVVIIDHGQGITSMYAQCSELLVKEGDKVEAKSVIAKVGSTGMATGPHLHLELRKNDKHFDPLTEGYLVKAENKEE